MAPTYILDNALSNVFCFPFWTYPVLQICSTLIQIIFSKCHDRYDKKYQYVNANNNDSNVDDKNETMLENIDDYRENNEIPPDGNEKIKKDSQIVVELIEKNTSLIITYLDKYTPLPQQIINLIVNDLYYDNDEKELWCKELDEKAEKVCRYFNRYLLFICALYLWCFILILWINIEWIDNENIDSWNGFQSLTISMIIYHPLSKLITPMSVMIDEEGHLNQVVKISMICICVLIGLCNFSGWLIFGFPSVFYYIVIWIVYFLVVLSYIFGLIKCVGDDTFDKWYFLLPFMIIYCFMAYSVIVYAMISMSCVYSKDLKGYGQWYMCLYQSLFSPYCPNIHFMYLNWKDWRAVTLFIAWMLF